MQLFLVGNDVVSVGEAAIKLSEPEDVSVIALSLSLSLSVRTEGNKLFRNSTVESR